jgi:hypothetical protein
MQSHRGNQHGGDDHCYANGQKDQHLYSVTRLYALSSPPSLLGLVIGEVDLFGVFFRKGLLFGTEADYPIGMVLAQSPPNSSSRISRSGSSSSKVFSNCFPA